MSAAPGPGPFDQLSIICEAAETRTGLIEEVLPVLAATAGAQSVVAMHRQRDLFIAGHHVGVPLETTVLPVETVRKLADDWLEGGTTRAVIRPLATGELALVFTWQTEPVDVSRLAPAISLVIGALSRIEAGRRYGDLVARLDEAERDRSAAEFEQIFEAAPEAIVVVGRSGDVVKANPQAARLLGGEPVGLSIDRLFPQSIVSGRANLAAGVDGRSLTLDVVVRHLESDDRGLTAVYLRDASLRRAAEAMPGGPREAQLRRRQALEINDRLVQGVTAAAMTLQGGRLRDTAFHLDRTLASARQMMDELLDPLIGEDLEPGDLIREPSGGSEPITEVQPTITGSVPGGPPWRILLADDDVDVRALLRMTIEAVGPYVVVGEAGDGEEVVRLASALRPHLVILDLSMPRTDGLQALPRLLASCPETKVIALSGLAEGTVAGQALAAGAAQYVEKGTHMDLATVIHQVLTDGR